MIRQGIEDYEVLRMLRTQVEQMTKDPANSKQVVEIDEKFKQAVETATKAATAGDLCSAMPSIANVRAEINDLLMKAEGKSIPAVSRVVEVIRNKGAGCVR